MSFPVLFWGLRTNISATAAPFSISDSQFHKAYLTYLPPVYYFSRGVQQPNWCVHGDRVWGPGPAGRSGQFPRSGVGGPEERASGGRRAGGCCRRRRLLGVARERRGNVPAARAASSRPALNAAVACGTLWHSAGVWPAAGPRVAWRQLGAADGLLPAPFRE